MAALPMTVRRWSSWRLRLLASRRFPLCTFGLLENKAERTALLLRCRANGFMVPLMWTTSAALWSELPTPKVGALFGALVGGGPRGSGRPVHAACPDSSERLVGEAHGEARRRRTGRPRLGQRQRNLCRDQRTYGEVVPQISDLKAVATKVQANALSELGLTTPEPGLTRDYSEKRIPVMDWAYVGNIASHGWEQGFRSGNAELMGFASRTKGSSSLRACWILLAGCPDPAPQSQSSRRVPGLKWLAANLAYVKDLNYAETRIAQLSSAKPKAGHAGCQRRERSRGRGSRAAAVAQRTQMQAIRVRGCRLSSGQLFLWFGVWVVIGYPPLILQVQLRLPKISCPRVFIVLLRGWLVLTCAPSLHTLVELDGMHSWRPFAKAKALETPLARSDVAACSERT